VQPLGETRGGTLVWRARAEERRWRDDAACRSVDPSLFFPAGVTGLAAIQITEAKAVCATCPVRVPCLDFALATNQEYGIWGGTSEEERREMRRAARAARRSAAESPRPRVWSGSDRAGSEVPEPAGLEAPGPEVALSPASKAGLSDGAALRSAS
jgi:WhiB family redox-sensing transcriptional regulator